MIRFRKLFDMPKEGDFSEAIITYYKQPSLYKSNCWDVGDIKECKSFVAEYKIFLKIDFWFFILGFRWNKIYDR